MTRTGLLALAGGGVVASALVGAALIGTLFGFDLEGPPEERLVPADSRAALSSLQIPVAVPLSDLEALIVAQIPNGGVLLKGTSDSLPLDVLRASLGLPQREEITCSPTPAARQAKATLQCLEDAGVDLTSKPKPRSGWRWIGDAAGNVWSGLGDVVKGTGCVLVGGIDTMDALLKAGEECVRERIPIELPRGREAQLHYEVRVDDVTLSMRGNTLMVRTDLVIGTEIEGGMRAFVDSFMNTAPVTDCDALLRITTPVTPVFRADNRPVTSGTGHGKLRLSATVGDSSFTDGMKCANGVTTQTTADTLFDLLLADFEATVERLMSDAIAGTLEDMASDPTHTDPINLALAEALTTAQRTIALAPALTGAPSELAAADPHLVLNLEGVVLRNLYGQRIARRAHIVLDVGGVLRPQITLGAPARTSPRWLPLTVGGSPNGFAVELEAQVDLARAEGIATAMAKDLVADLLPDLRLDDLSITLYQAGERLVLGAHVTGATWLGIDGTLYLTALPYVAPDTMALRLRDVKFDLASESFLLRRAGWVLEAPLETGIEDRFALPLGETVHSLRSALEHLRVDLPALSSGQTGTGVLELRLDDLSPGEIWLGDSALKATVRASGLGQIALSEGLLQNLTADP